MLCLIGYFTGGVGRFVERVGRFGVNSDKPSEIFSEEGKVDTFCASGVRLGVLREDTETYIEGREI